MTIQWRENIAGEWSTWIDVAEPVHLRFSCEWLARTEIEVRTKPPFESGYFRRVGVNGPPQKAEWFTEDPNWSDYKYERVYVTPKENAWVNGILDH